MRLFVAVYLTGVSVLLALAVGGGVALYRATEPNDPAEKAAGEHGYDLVSWETRHFPEKWLYKLAGAFSSRSDAEGDELVCEYFRVAPGERPGDIENDVEDVIEGRVTSILEDQKLALEPPLFEHLGLVFPPVDFELDATPRVLAVSPRERIELRDSYLLEPELAPETIEGIERQAESRNSPEGGVSALVIRTGGFSSYPSVVFENAPYESLIETVFHEWLHSYLVFFPLGTAYFRSSEARTLNESVANIAGKELAHLYFAKHGTFEEACGVASVAAEPTATPDAAEFDFATEMRALRVEVEELLAEERIEEAEALMAEKRDEFEAQGIVIRKLNQAYFAFHGFYADTPASIDPIGPKLQTLFERAGTTGQFVRTAAQITSRADLDAALE